MLIMHEKMPVSEIAGNVARAVHTDQDQLSWNWDPGRPNCLRACRISRNHSDTAGAELIL